jgi:tetratricopeptide (TPR) repeat protein
MDRAGVEHINLAYFGQAKPEYYQMSFTLLPGSTGVVARPKLPGYVAVSATILSGVYLPASGRLMYQAFRTLEPVARIGHSIYVYRIDRWPDAPAASAPEVELELADDLASIEWFSRAIRHYRRYLSARPDDVGARVSLALAQFDAGQIAEGVASFQLAARGHSDPAIRRALAAALLEYDSPAAARPEIVALLNLLPGDARSRELYGRLLLEEGSIAAGITELERALALDPTLTSARDVLTAAKSMASRERGGG